MCVSAGAGLCVCVGPARVFSGADLVLHPRVARGGKLLGRRNVHLIAEGGKPPQLLLCGEWRAEGYVVVARLTQQHTREKGAVGEA